MNEDSYADDLFENFEELIRKYEINPKEQNSSTSDETKRSQCQVNGEENHPADNHVPENVVDLASRNTEQCIRSCIENAQEFDKFVWHILPNIDLDDDDWSTLDCHDSPNDCHDGPKPSCENLKMQMVKDARGSSSKNEKSIRDQEKVSNCTKNVPEGKKKNTRVQSQKSKMCGIKKKTKKPVREKKVNKTTSKEQQCTSGRKANNNTVASRAAKEKSTSKSPQQKKRIEIKVSPKLKQIKFNKSRYSSFPAKLDQKRKMLSHTRKTSKLQYASVCTKTEQCLKSKRIRSGASNQTKIKPSKEMCTLEYGKLHKSTKQIKESKVKKINSRIIKTTNLNLRKRKVCDNCDKVISKPSRKRCSSKAVKENLDIRKGRIYNTINKINTVPAKKLHILRSIEQPKKYKINSIKQVKKTSVKKMCSRSAKMSETRKCLILRRVHVKKSKNNISYCAKQKSKNCAELTKKATRDKKVTEQQVQSTSRSLRWSNKDYLDLRKKINNDNQWSKGGKSDVKGTKVSTEANRYQLRKRKVSVGNNDTVIKASKKTCTLESHKQLIQKDSVKRGKNDVNGTKASTEANRYQLRKRKVNIGNNDTVIKASKKTCTLGSQKQLKQKDSFLSVKQPNSDQTKRNNKSKGATKIINLSKRSHIKIGKTTSSYSPKTALKVNKPQLKVKNGKARKKKIPPKGESSSK